MIYGTVSRANHEAGYYWIRRDDNGPDVFLGDRQLEIDGLAPLKPGARIKFDIQATNKGHRAVHVSVVR
jgi:cold shock protein